MPRLNFQASAELFPSRRYAKSLARYRRFDRAAEAIRYAIEDMPNDWLVGTMLDVDGKRIEGQAIRSLYEAADYPLKRKIAA